MNDELAKELIHSINAQNHLKEVELELKASVERDKAILTAQSHLNEAIKNDKLNPTIKSKGKIKFYARRTQIINSNEHAFYFKCFCVIHQFYIQTPSLFS